MGKPDYIPDDWAVWAEVKPYSFEDGGYNVVRMGADFKFATFIQESDAELFANMKNDVLFAGGGI